MPRIILKGYAFEFIDVSNRKKHKTLIARGRQRYQSLNFVWEFHIAKVSLEISFSVPWGHGMNSVALFEHALGIYLVVDECCNNSCNAPVNIESATITRPAGQSPRNRAGMPPKKSVVQENPKGTFLTSDPFDTKIVVCAILVSFKKINQSNKHPQW